MADDPVQGFGGRITSRARLPVTAILCIPLLAVAFQYLQFLLDRDFAFSVAIDQMKKDWALISFVTIIPVIVFSLFRELQFHAQIDRILGVRRKVGRRIASLMADLAADAGYDHPERIRSDSKRALEWFYVYANQPSALRTYVFEVWEGYFVGLYILLASLIAFFACVALAWFLPVRAIVPFAILAFLLFLAFWAMRRWQTIPKMLDAPVQQIKEIPSANVLAEARRRFG